LEEELAAARAEPEAGPDIATVNESLNDGVNRCPKCGSTDVRLRGSTAMLVCLFCRHEWQESRVEEEFGLGEGIDDLQGTVIAGGAEDISDDAAAVITLKCGGCGAEVVLDTAHALNARCHWLRQYRHTSWSVPGFWRTSVEPHLGQRLTPSSSSFEAVSIATGSGASISLRIGSGRVAGSIGDWPGVGGTSRGEPGPVYGGTGGVVALDMGVRSVAYRPRAFALSAS
jgi:uncharacterized Zn ribbon protein